MIEPSASETTDGARSGGARSGGARSGGARSGDAQTDGGRVESPSVDGVPARATAEQALAIARYEAGKRGRGAMVLLGLLVALAGLDLAFFPSIEQSGMDLEAYFESMPPAMQEAFGGAGLGTIEGFLVAEFYQFAWVLALGMYLAYRAGGLLAGDVERDRMDLLLATPVSRRAVVAGKFLSLVPMLLLVNVVVPVVIYVGVELIGESISAADLVMVHLLSFPYLLACAGVGLLLSAVASSADVGQRAGMGAVFTMYLLESVTARTDFEWIGAFTLPRYYETAPVLTEGTYDLAGAGVLLAVTAILLAASAWLFGRRDL